MPRFFSHVMWKYVDSVLGMSVFFVLMVLLCFAPDQSTNAPAQEPTIYYIEGEREEGNVVYRLEEVLKGKAGEYVVYWESREAGVTIEITSGIFGVDRMLTRGGFEWEFMGGYQFLGKGKEEVRVVGADRHREGARLKLVQLKSYINEESSRSDKRDWIGARSSLAGIPTWGDRDKTENAKGLTGQGEISGERGEDGGGTIKAGSSIYTVELLRLSQVYGEGTNAVLINSCEDGTGQLGFPPPLAGPWIIAANSDGMVDIIAEIDGFAIPYGVFPFYAGWAVEDKFGREIISMPPGVDQPSAPYYYPPWNMYPEIVFFKGSALLPLDSGTVSSLGYLPASIITLDTKKHGNQFRFVVKGYANGIGILAVDRYIDIHVIDFDGGGGASLCGIGGGSGGNGFSDGSATSGDGGKVTVDVSSNGATVWVSAGKGSFGKGWGSFLLSDSNDDEAWDSSELQFTGEAEDLVYTGGVLRQVTTLTNVIDVVDTGTNTFQIEFRNKNFPSGPAYEIIQMQKAVEQSASINETIRGVVSEIEITQVGNTTITTVKEGGDGLGNFERETETKVTNDTPSVGKEEESITVREMGQVVSQVTRVYGIYDWGKVLEEESSPDGRVTQWTYYQNGEETGRLQKEEELHSGKKREYMYTYDATTGELTRIEELSTWTDTDQARNEKRIIDTLVPERETIEVSISGMLVSKRFRERTDYQLIEKEATDASQDWSSAELVSVTEYYAEGSEFEGEIKSVSHADGTAEFYSYSMNGGMKTTTVERGEPDSGGTSIVDGQREITITNEQGGTDSRTVEDIVSGLMIESEIGSNFDDLGRAQTVTYLDGAVEHYVYSNCCGLESFTDRSGVTTTYGYDDLNRLVEIMRLGITQRTVYSGVQVMTQREGSDGSVITTSIVQSDSSGNVEWEMDGVGAQTFYSRDYSAALGWEETMDLPPMPGQGAAMRVEEYYADGQLRKVSGSAVADREYSYGTHSFYGTQGTYTRETRLNASGGTEEWMETYYDFVGRVIAIRKPSGDGSGYVEWLKQYNSKGQLTAEQDPDGVRVLYAYDGKGEGLGSAIDLSSGGGAGNGKIDISGSDRISALRRDYVVYQGVSCAHSQKLTLPQEGNGTFVVVSESWEGLDANKSWVKNASGAESERETTYSGNGDWVESVTEPSGAYTESVYVGGRRESVTRYDSLGVQLRRTDYTYDAHGRVEAETDARIGGTTYSYTDRDEVESVTTPAGQETTTSYTQRGPAYQRELADGSTQDFTYHNTGQLLREEGAQLYTKEYSYDEQNRLKTLTTYRDESGGVSAVTTWIYNVYRGYLEEKQYDDGKGPLYYYTDGGRIAYREWARGVVTQYVYNYAGELSEKKYWTDNTLSVPDPDTDDVRFTYTRWGALDVVEQVDDGGVVVLGHDYDYRNDFLLAKETQSGLLDRVLTRKYEDGSGSSVVGRNAGFMVGSVSVANEDYEVSYTYDEAGRMKVISDANESFSYTYVPNSARLVNSVASSVHTSSYTYESSKNVLQSVHNVANSVVISDYAYTSNALDQRTHVVHTGTAFSYRDGDNFNEYLYDDYGQLKDAKKYLGTDIMDKSNPTNDDYTYEYDEVGNREEDAFYDYTINDLNQVEGFTTGGWTRDYSYDEDGNRVFIDESSIFGIDGSYKWDGENRLLRYRANFSGGGVYLHYDYRYDYLGRRVELEDVAWSGDKKRFVYEGWNVVNVYDANNSNELLKVHTWGLDVSGSIQGAGGVGGLLSVEEKEEDVGVYHFMYDGRGNVVQIVDGSDGGLEVHYDYSPYGQKQTVFVGSYRSNAWLFQTKYLAPFPSDTEGLYYFGHRYYNPDTGRWLNRDPLGSLGTVSSSVITRNDLEGFLGFAELLPEGPNIYAFIGNDPINGWDLLGLAFQDLWNSYPTGSGSAFAKLAGGKVEQNINAGFFNNKCALRVSHALNDSEELIIPFIKGQTSSGKVQANGDKWWYIFRVKVLQSFLTSKWGKPSVVLSKKKDKDDFKCLLKDKQGVILFLVPFESGTATGHATLWNGKKLVDGNSGDFSSEASKILLWERK